MLKYLSLKASIILLVVTACLAVLAVGVQAWLLAANPAVIALTSAVAVVILVALGTLVCRGACSAIGQIDRLVDGLRSGDLTRRSDAQLAGEIGALARGIGAGLEGLDFVVQRIERAARLIARAGSDIRRDCVDLSSGSGERAAALSRAASSIEQLASTVRSNSENAQRATRMASEAEMHAAEGAEVLTSAIVAMDEIAGSGRRIGDVVAIIDAIAFQTNLLALNAAVEAARAGESGRGFAVVASEVRNLAQRASAAAREIRELIRVSVEAVEQGEHLVTRTGEAFSEIRGAVLKMHEIVSEIAAASGAQHSDIEQVNLAVEQMERATRGNEALAGRAADGAAALVDEARALTAAVGRYRGSGAPAQSAGPRDTVRVLESPGWRSGDRD